MERVNEVRIVRRGKQREGIIKKEKPLKRKN